MLASPAYCDVLKWIDNGNVATLANSNAASQLENITFYCEEESFSSGAIITYINLRGEYQYKDVMLSGLLLELSPPSIKYSYLGTHTLKDKVEVQSVIDAQTEPFKAQYNSATSFYNRLLSDSVSGAINTSFGLISIETTGNGLFDFLMTCASSRELNELKQDTSTLINSMDVSLDTLGNNHTAIDMLDKYGVNPMFKSSVSFDTAIAYIKRNSNLSPKWFSVTRGYGSSTGYYVVKHVGRDVYKAVPKQFYINGIKTIQPTIMITSKRDLSVYSPLPIGIFINSASMYAMDNREFKHLMHLTLIPP